MEKIVGLKKNEGKTQQKTLVECRMALTPDEAEQVVWQEGKPFLPEGMLAKVKTEKVQTRFLRFAEAELRGMGLPPELGRLLTAADVMPSKELLLREVRHGAVLMAHFPSPKSKLGQCLRHESSFAVQFMAAWLALGEQEGREYFCYYLKGACRPKAQAELVAWLAERTAQSGQQAAQAA